ncbi:putative lipid-transfer protein DIR1 [Wolffia australiana]
MVGKREVLAAVVVVAIVMAMAAEVGALDICNIDAEKLAQCLPAIRGGGTPVPPNKECCGALRSADLPCLCRYKGNVILKSVGIDPELAAQLPTKCGLNAPPECQAP